MSDFIERLDRVIQMSDAIDRKAREILAELERLKAEVGQSTGAEERPEPWQQ